MSTPTPTRAPVAGPPALEPPMYGLASVIEGPTLGDGRWQINGVTYDTDHCAASGHVDGMCPVITPGPPVDQTASVVLAVQTVTPPALTANLSWTTTPEAAATHRQHMVLAKDTGTGVVTIDNEAASGTGNKTVHFQLAEDATPGTVLLEDDLTEAGLPQDITAHVTDGTTYRLTWSYTGGTVAPETLTFDPATIPAAGTTQDLTLTDPVSAYTLTATSTDAASGTPVDITVNGTKKTLPPAGNVTWTGQAAGASKPAYTSSLGTVTPATSDLTLPLAAPAARALTIQPAATYTYTAASAADSEFTAALSSTPAGVSGTVAPGATTAATAIAAGTYTVTATGATGTVDLVVPGPDVTLALTRQVPGPDQSTHDKPLASGPTWADGFDPFTVYHRFECNAVAIGDNPRERALERLALSEWREVEAGYWAQLVALHEAGRAIDLGVADPGIDFKEALGTLEFGARHHGRYNGRPTLHVPGWTQPYFSHFNLIEDDNRDGVMRTRLGSRIAFYTGYDASTQVPAGTFLAFATGTVRAHASAPFVNESFDPPTNTRTFMAERTWAFDHDCLTAVIRMSVVGLG